MVFKGENLVDQNHSKLNEQNSFEDEEFENTDAGASMCTDTETSRLKIGSLVMIKNFPCKVTEVSTAKTGKHGSAKVILKGKDIMTDKTYECTYHAGEMVDAPICKKVEYTLLDIQDETLQLLTEKGETKEDLCLPEAEHLKDVKKKILDSFNDGEKQVIVQVLYCLGKQQIVDAKAMNL